MTQPINGVDLFAPPHAALRQRVPDDGRSFVSAIVVSV
jgi:hypothetical protein